jgi:ABC-2 type transport system permease protein
VGFADLWSAEIIKFRTLRSYLITAVAAILVAGIGGAIMGGALDDQGNVPGLGTSIQVITLPMEVVIYAMLVLGVLMATGDMRSGTFRITSIMAPWRNRVVAAKFSAAAAIALVITIVALAAAWVGGLITGGSRFSPMAGDGTMLIITHLLAVPLATVLGTAVGMLLRNTAGAISALLIWALAVEAVLVYTIPPEVVAFLPFKTVGAAAANLSLGALPGLGMFTLYVAIAAGLAVYVHQRRDLG